ncbi:chorismate mutase [Streptomyces sp. SID10853]|nr:chorismate mutase [Streptomyces sp. SID10853]
MSTSTHTGPQTHSTDPHSTDLHSTDLHGAEPHSTDPHSTDLHSTGAHTGEAAGVITGARERIDSLDDRIIGLIQERMAVSAVIQDARMTSGGRRVNLSREMEVLGHYSEALGKPGTGLAMTVLELCRGRI